MVPNEKANRTADCLERISRLMTCVTKTVQRGLSAVETGCERWNIKTNENKTQAIYSYRCRPPEAHLTLSGRNIGLDGDRT
jgi:hypothetical protein